MGVRWFLVAVCVYLCASSAFGSAAPSDIWTAPSGASPTREQMEAFLLNAEILDAEDVAKGISEIVGQATAALLFRSVRLRACTAS